MKHSQEQEPDRNNDLENEYRTLLSNMKKHFFGGIANKVGQIPRLVPTLTEPLRQTGNAIKSRWQQTPEQQMDWLAAQMSSNSAVRRAVDEREEMEARVKFERFMKSQHN